MKVRTVVEYSAIKSIQYHESPEDSDATFGILIGPFVDSKHTHIIYLLGRTGNW